MHKDIGKHEHEMIIFDSYETYAVCKKCGMHDWEQLTVGGFQRKYPKHEVESI